MNASLELLWPWLPLMGRGFALNLGMGVLAMLLAILCGTLLGAAQLAPAHWLRRSAGLLTQLLRNSPWLVVMFFVMHLLPYELRIGGAALALPAWAKAVLALALPATGNFSEIVRGGLRTVPLTQWEAATALGYGRAGRLWQVILPQALRHMLAPALGLYCVVTMSTSLASLVGVGELLGIAREVLAAEARTELLLPVYGLVLLMFFAYIFPLSLLARALERRWSRGGQSS
ncbi:amino acid ABC transporter permease [Stutzerimonas kirkiae]|uniref:Polar amino acid ABC transporter permease n=1 Tax=Stutzerimonas kirkiae TaxID=2211392 RepID=A0A4Q9RCF7_9GAMM|nr:ABC transporter permease subunit [Stutzerimonas kirkiae]TBU98575.1 polar amino acid ABC transporter permease [Stutzerimonas kirkiae]TBV04251.1 polar amino acid ABC transporter permease [Stutzerimonas kirkiae]TBV10955.1 polar amino acid ABC transporter permease [Stutzerimonas kirkiae]TBV14315.1 polar amino acid ABC transporter permease [Stutzerimonas kirkiae]